MGSIPGQRTKIPHAALTQIKKQIKDITEIGIKYGLSIIIMYQHCPLVMTGYHKHINDRGKRELSVIFL